MGVIGILVLSSWVLLLQLVMGRSTAPGIVSTAYIHARNGFYLNTLANRWVDRFWPVWDRIPLQNKNSN
jgi:hypothetical protein